MSHGVKNFTWRDGRPRWLPSPRLRELGFKGRDLRGSGGHWLPLEPALEAARRLNSEAGVKEKPPAAKSDRPGYVYFILTAGTVKIGYSVNPLARGYTLMTGIAGEISAIIAVRGTIADEQYLHAAFRQMHVAGEWFRAEKPVLDLMSKCVLAGRIRRPRKQK